MGKGKGGLCVKGEAVKIERKRDLKRMKRIVDLKIQSPLVKQCTFGILTGSGPWQMLEIGEYERIGGCGEEFVFSW